MKRSLKITSMHPTFPGVKNSRPCWWEGAVIYEIYPRSFQDSNNDGIGDLRGIEQRLPYLAELGVDAIWIAPFYKSPMADFGYDVSDYTAIEEMFGSMEDFDLLLHSAHQNNLRVIIDFVPNHTSDQHPWFVESRSSRTNSKRDWYIWRDSGSASQDTENGKAPPNNWPSFFGGSAWTWDQQTEQHYLHLFLDRQPDLNWRNPEVVEAMENALRFWFDKGIDGFRLDAIGFLAKHPDLPDLPKLPNATGGDATNADLVQYHIYTNNLPEIHDILRGFRRVADSYEKELIFIGETGSLDPDELSQFYGRDQDELHLPQIFLPHHTEWNAKSMQDCLVSFYEALPPGTTPHFNFANHDARRLTDRYGVHNHRSVGMLLLTLLAAPCLYYGDELGMREGIIPPEKKRDPFDGYMADHSLGRDPARTPMQWNSTANASFTSECVEPWLPVNPDYLVINVETQRNDPTSTLNFYKQLLSFRKQSPALRTGSIQFLEVGNGDVLAYRRTSDKEQLLIAINFSAEAQQVDLSSLTSTPINVLSSRMQSPEISSAVITLHPHESILISLT